MSIHGKVTTWYMTPEQLAEYVKKHPIVPYDKPSGSTFVEVHDMQYQKSKEERNARKGNRQSTERAVDKVDKQKAHELYMAGEKMIDMATKLNVSMTTLGNFLKEQRQLEPEKWPRRQKRK